MQLVVVVVVAELKLLNVLNAFQLMHVIVLTVKGKKTEERRKKKTTK